MLDDIKNFLAPKTSERRFITVTSYAAFDNVPMGWFRVETVSGKQTLGYRGVNGFCFDVGRTVVDGAKRVTLEVPVSELPLVKLNFQKPNSTSAFGRTILDTDELDSDGTVNWQGAEPRNGVEWA